MNVSYAQIIRDTEIRSNYFGYINFKRTHITLPDTVFNLAFRNLNTETETCIQGMFFDKKQKLKTLSDSLRSGLFSQERIEWIGKQEISESFVNLLCDNDMVSIAGDYGNSYMRPSYRENRDTIIRDFKEWNEFWFLGKISINPNYDSYLIFTREKDTAGILFTRSLFLMNVKDNRITSLTQIAYKFIFWGEGPYFFTKASSRGRYCYYGIYYSTCIFLNRLGKQVDIPKEEKYTYYSFDNNGYVQLHDLKGRKKLIITKQKYKSLIHENIR